MIRCTTRLLAAGLLLLASPAYGQTNNNPLPRPIDATEGLIVVNVREFATIPDHDGQAPRMMLLMDEPATRRLFVNDMYGPLYTVSYDGRTVTRYVDINDARWGVGVEAGARERGFQSFTVHPQFGQPGTPGYGRFYTWTDIQDTQGRADFVPGEGGNVHHTVLLEWVARTPSAATYDGGPPREMMRLEQPFSNHNAGHIAFNPLATPGNPDFGLLYMGSADGGSGGDPLNLSQDLGSIFGKILRIDPLGSNSANGKYGIPASNPFVGRADVLPEIYASGARNPQRFGWDPANGNLFLADIGQNLVEEVSLVTPGANLGWNLWEGSFRYISRTEVSLDNPRGDPRMTYPLVEYGHTDPLSLESQAVTGIHVYRASAIPQLRNLVLFGNFPNGEIFAFDADHLPQGGNTGIRRVLLREGDATRTLLELVQARNRQQGREPATRADLRINSGPDGQVLLTNKHDGTIRVLVP